MFHRVAAPRTASTTSKERGSARFACETHADTRESERVYVTMLGRATRGLRGREGGKEGTPTPSDFIAMHHTQPKTRSRSRGPLNGEAHSS